MARGLMGGQGPRFSKEAILVEIFHFFSNLVFNDFLVLASMVAFRGHFEAVRGHIKLGSSYDLIWTYLSDIFVKELQLFLDLAPRPPWWGASYGPKHNAFW